MRVHAAAVNFPDVLLIAGKYQVKIPPPFIPGSELAGEVIAVGEGAAFRPGQRVSATTFVGAFAEQALLRRGGGDSMPDDVDFASAAAFGVTYRTAYHALRSIAAVAAGRLGGRARRRGRRGPGGGRSGGGDEGAGAGRGVEPGEARAVPAARRRGDRRLRPGGPEERASASSPATPRAWSSTRSADRTRSPRCAGSPVAAPSSPSATPPATIPSIPLNLVLLKGITVRGMEIRTFMTDRPDDAARDMRELSQMFAAGTVRPYIGARFPLAETAAALRHVADRKVLGKVVIDVG